MSVLVVKAICRRIEARYGSNRNAAMAAGVSTSVWSNYCSNEHRSSIPFATILHLADASEKAAFIALLEGEGPSPGSLMTEASEAMEVSADMHRTVREATADGQITPLEAKRILAKALEVRAEVDDVIASVPTQRAALRAV